MIFITYCLLSLRNFRLSVDSSCVKYNSSEILPTVLQIMCISCSTVYQSTEPLTILLELKVVCVSVEHLYH